MWKIIEISPTVRPYQKQIQSALDAVQDRIKQFTKPKPVEFSIKANRSRTIQSLGLGGFCCDPKLIRLFFDPKNPAMEQNLDEVLIRTIAHEYHHLLRANGPGYGAKLGSALVAEGLAGHFVKQLYNSPPEPWESALSKSELFPWRKKAFENFDARDHGHAKWFFGAEGNPHWLGYTLGYDMIGRYLEQNSSQTPLTLANMQYSEFREYVLAE